MRLHISQQGVNPVVYFRGIGPCRLKDHTLDTRMPVLASIEAVTLLAQLDVGNVSQPQDFAVGGGADNDITELLGGL